MPWTVLSSKVATLCEPSPPNVFFVGRSRILIIRPGICRLAYRNGVTTAVTAPSGNKGFLQGVSTAFSAGSPNALAKGAIIQEETALHITISLTLAPSVSTQIAALRSQLFESSLKHWVRVRKVCRHLLCLHNISPILINSIFISTGRHPACRKRRKCRYHGNTCESQTRV